MRGDSHVMKNWNFSTVLRGVFPTRQHKKFNIGLANEKFQFFILALTAKKNYYSTKSINVKNSLKLRCKEKKLCSFFITENKIEK